MKTLVLHLTTPQGEEVARFPLDGVAVASPGEALSNERSSLSQEMDDLMDRLLRTVQNEGLEIALEPLELRIALSRALLATEEAHEIPLNLPVRLQDRTQEDRRFRSDLSTRKEAESNKSAESLNISSLDELFQLDDLAGEVNHA